MGAKYHSTVRSLQWKWRWLTVILLFFDEIVLEQRLKWVDDDIAYFMNNQRNLVIMQYCLNEHNQSNFLDFFLTVTVNISNFLTFYIFGFYVVYHLIQLSYSFAGWVYQIFQQKILKWIIKLKFVNNWRTGAIGVMRHLKKWIAPSLYNRYVG